DPLAREKKRQPLELRHGARDRLAEAPCRHGGADRDHGWLRMANPLDVVIGAAEVALLLLLLRAAAPLAPSGMGGWRRAAEAPPRLADGAHPRVTVLLPIRNERYVVERTLRAACALSWPRAELEIRVLDDSDDDTSTLLDRVAAELRGEGAPVAVLRRGDRRGFKAGAPRQGLRAAPRAHVCVLGARCSP